MKYVFDVKIAQKYGVEEAILLENFKFWIAKNKADGRNFFDGHWWTYCSVSALQELFPFWTEKQIYRIISSLLENGAIISGNYNKTAYDRTRWFAIIDDDILKEISDINTENKVNIHWLNELNQENKDGDALRCIGNTDLPKSGNGITQNGNSANIRLPDESKQRNQDGEPFSHFGNIEMPKSENQKSQIGKSICGNGKTNTRYNTDINTDVINKGERFASESENGLPIATKIITSKPKVKDFIDELLYVFTSLYRKHFARDFVLGNEGKERKQIKKLYDLIISRRPEGEKPFEFFKNFLEFCMLIDDDFVRERMSPSYIVSQINWFWGKYLESKQANKQPTKEPNYYDYIVKQNEEFEKKYREQSNDDPVQITSMLKDFLSKFPWSGSENKPS